MGVGGSPGPHKMNEGCPHAGADVSACGLCFPSVLDGGKEHIVINSGNPHWKHWVTPTCTDLRYEVLLVQAHAC